MTHRMLRVVVVTAGLALVPGGAIPAASQLPLAPPAPEQAPAPPAADAAADAEPDAESPDSPRASLRAFLDQGRAGRWDEAGRYLSVPEDQAARRPELAERLKAVLDRYLWFDLQGISGASGGRQDDALPTDVEEVGVLRVGDEPPTPLRMVRVPAADGDYWAFTGNVVRQVDAWYGSLEARWIMDWLARMGLHTLLGLGPFDIMWWQWLALLVIVPIVWIGGRVLGSLTRAVMTRLSASTSSDWDDRLFAAIGPPIRFAWMLALFSAVAQNLGLTIPAERVIGHIVKGAAVVTLFWGLWRSVNVVAELILTRPWAVGSPSARHLLTIGSNLVKGAIVVLGTLSLLAAFGYPVTTLLAGLGIGGLALAFGAQKTVENLFGSMSLAVDQPFRVGDFVKVEDFVGTVEDIGLRSTRIRTLDRTIVSIPNGKLADQRLESFAVRDRMRLATTIGVEYGTTNAQMQQVLEGFERVLREHPKIWSEAMVVKFAAFGASSLDIEIMAWFDVPTWGDFQLCRQEVLLGFMQVVEQAGTAFAFPTRTVHLVGGPAPASLSAGAS